MTTLKEMSSAIFLAAQELGITLVSPYTQSGKRIGEPLERYIEGRLFQAKIRVALLAGPDWQEPQRDEPHAKHYSPDQVKLIYGQLILDKGRNARDNLRQTEVTDEVIGLAANRVLYSKEEN